MNKDCHRRRCRPCHNRRCRRGHPRRCRRHHPRRCGRHHHRLCRRHQPRRCRRFPSWGRTLQPFLIACSNSFCVFVLIGTKPLVVGSRMPKTMRFRDFFFGRCEVQQPIPGEKHCAHKTSKHSHRGKRT